MQHGMGLGGGECTEKDLKDSKMRKQNRPIFMSQGERGTSRKVMANRKQHVWSNRGLKTIRKNYKKQGLLEGKKEPEKRGHLVVKKRKKRC